MLGDIRITLAANGLLVCVPSTISDKVQDMFVYDYGDETLGAEKKEYEAIQAALYKVLEHIKANSKHNSFRIDIEIKKQ